MMAMVSYVSNYWKTYFDYLQLLKTLNENLNDLRMYLKRWEQSS